jgi:hypothetical protein
MGDFHPKGNKYLTVDVTTRRIVEASFKLSLGRQVQLQPFQLASDVLLGSSLDRP